MILEAYNLMNKGVVTQGRLGQGHIILFSLSCHQILGTISIFDAHPIAQSFTTFYIGFLHYNSIYFITTF